MATEPRDVSILIERARNGDRSAFGRLVDPYRDQLRSRVQRQVSGKIQCRADASDVVQDALLDALRHIGTFRGNTELEFLNWLLTICSTWAAKTIQIHVRTQKRSLNSEQLMGVHDRGDAHLGGAVTSSTASQKVVQQEDEQQLAHAKARLTDRERTVIELHFEQGLPIAEVSQRVDSSYDAVVGLLTRAMRKLRRDMGQDQ